MQPSALLTGSLGVVCTIQKVRPDIYLAFLMESER